MVERRAERVRFSAGAARAGPMTWAQLAGWNRVRREGAAPLSLGLFRVLPVAGYPFGTVVGCAREIVERHEAARTRFTAGAAGGPPGQEVVADGAFDVAVVDLPHRDAGELHRRTTSLIAELRPRAADPTADWLTYFGLVTLRGEPQCLVFVMSHFVVDATGMDLVAAELAALICGDRPPGPPPGSWAPLDLADYERGPEGRAMNARAVAQWERHFRDAPAAMFPAVRGPAAEPRRVEIAMRSAALRTAAPLAAAGHRVTPMAVLLTATCVALHRYSGTEQCALELVAANRWRAAARHAVCALAMHGPLLVYVAGVPFAELLPRVAAAALASHRFSHHDPAALDAVAARVGRERGAPVERGCVVNFMPGDAPVAAGAVRPDPRGLLHATRFAEVGRQRSNDFRFRLTVQDIDGAWRLSLDGDRKYLDVPDMYETLRTIESLVVDAAGGQG